MSNVVLFQYVICTHNTYVVSYDHVLMSVTILHEYFEKLLSIVKYMGMGCRHTEYTHRDAWHCRPCKYDQKYTGTRQYMSTKAKTGKLTYWEHEVMCR